MGSWHRKAGVIARPPVHIHNPASVDAWIGCQIALMALRESSLPPGAGMERSGHMFYRGASAKLLCWHCEYMD